MSRTDKAAGAANVLRFTELGTVTEVKLAAPDEKGNRRFQMHAYTGAAVTVWGGRMVVDLASLSIGPKRKPILLNHDPATIAGYSEEVVVGPDGIQITGRLSKTTAAGKEVTELADEGFPWQSSIGFRPGPIEVFGEGEKVTVNNREFTGPIAVVRGGKLNESSFVPLGADSDTSAAVFADGSRFEWPNTPAKEETMSDKDNADALNASFKEGAATVKAELAAMLAAFPTDPAFAVQQFAAGKSLVEAKLAKAELATAELAAVTAKLADAEKRLSLSQSGQAPVGVVAPAPVELAAKPSDPKAAAKWEWDNEKPAGFTSEANYIAVRTAELSGKLRSFSK